ncbi:hypothetical protein Gogos_015419 [Gossypium gossypioides]|uniref:Uncharacterized protein n=1 Tax=Gossypium gossypioides TaxID=34282 RepID=A0A7J9C1J6_GOSGO|nr:hypothetical protein [Gossypium gossypioides]
MDETASPVMRRNDEYLLRSLIVDSKPHEPLFGESRQPLLDEQLMKTISKLASSSSTSQVKYVSGNGNTYDATCQGYVTKEKLLRLLVEKNKSLRFSEFDLKLPYLVRVAANPYPKDYTSAKFMKFNEKTSDAREHVEKVVETLGVVELDDNLMLN